MSDSVNQNGILLFVILVHLLALSEKEIFFVFCLADLQALYEFIGHDSFVVALISILFASFISIIVIVTIWK